MSQRGLLFLVVTPHPIAVLNFGFSYVSKTNLAAMNRDGILLPRKKKGLDR